jgi:ElaA protein
MIHWEIKHYTDLSTDEFHDLLALRIAIFVVEQNCPYPELDGKDKKGFHLIGRHENNEIVATSRILPRGVSYADWSIGRVAIAVSHRGQKLGYVMMEESLAFIQSQEKNPTIRISAQAHLEPFYANVGFTSTEKKYDEDGIPHVEMLWG